MAVKKAKKKTVYLNEEGNKIRTVPQTTIDDMKEAFKKMVNRYIRLKKCECEFNESMEELLMIMRPWTIPSPWYENSLKDIRGR